MQTTNKHKTIDHSFAQNSLIANKHVSNRE